MKLAVRRTCLGDRLCFPEIVGGCPGVSGIHPGNQLCGGIDGLGVVANTVVRPTGGQP
jgi:hypothetical protein